MNAGLRIWTDPRLWDEDVLRRFCAEMRAVLGMGPRMDCEKRAVVPAVEGVGNDGGAGVVGCPGIGGMCAVEAPPSPLSECVPWRAAFLQTTKIDIIADPPIPTPGHFF